MEFNMDLYSFIIGLFVGSTAGILIAALCNAARGD